QLSYTYTHGTVQFDALPNGNTVVDIMNSDIAQYNAYTSACANNPNLHVGGQAVCQFKGSVVKDSTNNTAPPCYTPAGVGEPTCAAGDIANPYWNAPAQGFLDPNQEFVAYNNLASTSAATSVVSSYIIPHVASLLLSYKHNALRVSPSFQFAAGGKYGAPTQ